MTEMYVSTWEIKLKIGDNFFLLSSNWNLEFKFKCEIRLPWRKILQQALVCQSDFNSITIIFNLVVTLIFKLLTISFPKKNFELEQISWDLNSACNNANTLIIFTIWISQPERSYESSRPLT